MHRHDLTYARGMRWMYASIFGLSSIVLAQAPVHAQAQTDADPRVDADAMEVSMVRYFRGERLGGVAFASVGMTSLVAGGLMVDSSSDFRRGLSYPLLVLGGAQFLVGSVVLITPGLRMRRFKRQIRESPAIYRTRERKRVLGIGSTVRYLLYTELAIAVSGVGLAIYGAREDKDLIAGIGVGLTIEALTLLIQDTFVKRRARGYLRALTDFRLTVTPRQRGVWLSYARLL